MAGAQNDPHKWQLPGWRIEQKYANKTLIGNWCEERKVFERGRRSSMTTTQKAAYKMYPDHKPDTIVRHSAQMRMEGLEKQHIFSHHGDRHKKNMISWYDEHYNGRVREEGDKLPDLRSWDGQKLAWAPEKTDYPMQGAPTNFGLYTKAKERWIKELQALRQGHYKTDYGIAYEKAPPVSAYPHRYACAPRHLSSHFNTTTKVNKDLWLRRSPYNVPPEHPPKVSPPMN